MACVAPSSAHFTQPFKIKHLQVQVHSESVLAIVPASLKQVQAAPTIAAGAFLSDIVGLGISLELDLDITSGHRLAGGQGNTEE